LDGGILSCANKIKSICLTLKALSDDGAFSAYRRKLFAELQRLSLSIGMEDRMDEFEESDHPRDESGRFESKGGAKSTRKGKMVPEVKVEYSNAGAVMRDKVGKPVTHFNHDEEKMRVTKQVRVSDPDGNKYKICRGEIEHLTVFAGNGTSAPLRVEDKLIEQSGGKSGSWKHCKGIGMVVGPDGKQRKADLHWFESPEVGQTRWKIKQFAEDMDESKIYW